MTALTDLSAEMRERAARFLTGGGVCRHEANALNEFATRLDALAQAWISVEDRLPDEGQHIVGSNADGGMWTEYFSHAEPLGRMQWWASLPPIPPLTPTGAKS